LILLLGYKNLEAFYAFLYLPAPSPVEGAGVRLQQFLCAKRSILFSSGFIS